MRFREKLKSWREYSIMSDLGIITRRKFFNNCFDGALTCAGIVSGIFIIFLSPTANQFTTRTVIVTGFATALAIGISGLWGAFLSEEAERKKKVDDMKRDMAMHEQIPVEKRKKDIRNKNQKNEKTLLEKAEQFATIVASLVDGGAPVLGSSLPLIPFFFGTSLTLLHFIFSYVVLVVLLVYLGNFLGKISGGGRLRYALHLVAAGVVTLLISIALGI
ncbi:MAG: VIT1/CCC1 transporter family protein [Candidatus Heimdallarchaeota archaeon]